MARSLARGSTTVLGVASGARRGYCRMAVPSTLDPKAQAALALNRFGLGPRAGAIAAIAADPRGALIAELERPDAGRISDPALPTTAAAARAAFEFQRAQRA